MTEPVENNQEDIIKEAVRRFVDAKWQGKEPDIDEFVGQYPGLEHQIRQDIKDALRIDALFDSLSQADENDFKETAAEHYLVGRKIGSFEITKMIGRGGMGVVYLARDTKLKRPVAIKSMPAKLAADSTTRMRFRREAELLASLNHPNIAVIHEIIEEEKSGYLILEYVLGETLTEHMAREPLTLEQALSISQQIAEAASAAHKKGIVHRDLKPSNIKITPEGRIKVLDFGLAKPSAHEGKSSEITETQPGRVIGTPAYMSPEQARGKFTDHRTDIWSFGCILYQMLSGRLPFEGETATDTLVRIIEREPNWELLPQNTPGNIRTLLRRCLDKDPNRRLTDISDAAMEISETLSRPQTVPTAKLRRITAILSVAIIIVVLAIALYFPSEKQAQPSSSEIRLVVLPFENLGPTEDEYFVDGITDAITARLAVIHGLGVISRQSAMQYKKREKNTRQIAEELDVDYILEGTVQRERPSDPTSKVRVIPQLISVSNDAHVWSDIYDNDMHEVFQIQSDLAERIAQALDIALLEPERQALRTRPTANIEAYEYYLRGNDYFHRSIHENDMTIAIRMYEKAVELDAAFALAHARLSSAHVDMYWLYYDPSEQRLTMAKQAVDKALELDPDLPEGYIAMGWYYYHGHQEYESALEQFAIARKGQPNNSELLFATGLVQRRQGRFEKALANIEGACKLDPLSSKHAYEAGYTLMMLRRYWEAERYFDRAISLAPDVREVYSHKARLYLLWEGSVEKARAVLAEALQNVKATEDAFYAHLLVTFDVYDGNYQEALDRISLKSEIYDYPSSFTPNVLRRAEICGYMGNEELKEQYYESAVATLEKKVAEDPNDHRFHSSLGKAYAGLGRQEAAIREGKRGVELLPVSKDAMRGLARVEDLARIYAMVGEYDLAIDQIEFLLSRPGGMSIPLLRLDPAWNSLRNHPRFQKLIEQGK